MQFINQQMCVCVCVCVYIYTCTYIWGFPGGASGKGPMCRRHMRRGLDPWVGQSPEGRHGNSRQYSCLENPMDRGAWWATNHGVAQSQTRLKRLSTHIYIQGSNLNERIRKPIFAQYLFCASSHVAKVLLSSFCIQRLCLGFKRIYCLHIFIISFSNATKTPRAFYVRIKITVINYQVHLVQTFLLVYVYHLFYQHHGPKNAHSMALILYFWKLTQDELKRMSKMSHLR